MKSNIFKTVFFLTLPLLLLIISIYIAIGVSLYNAEIRNFHGYLLRNLRIGGTKNIISFVLSPLLNGKEERFLPNNYKIQSMKISTNFFDLRIEDNKLKKLMKNIPFSSKEWQKAWLIYHNRKHRVDVRLRGQRLTNYFWPRKSWLIKSPKKDFINGTRLIKLTPLIGRLDNYIASWLATQCNMPAAKFSIVELFINQKSHGLYFQEEEIDESFVRRLGKMPGDVFHGELFVPNEPQYNSINLFMNPFYWEKKSKNNRYSDEWRPYLTELLDIIAEDNFDSFGKLYKLIDRLLFVKYFGILSFIGDWHIDNAHNLKLYFNPLSGKFEPILWNPLINNSKLPIVETTNNLLFEKLARDPMFLDDVQQFIYSKLIKEGLIDSLIAHLNEIEKQYYQQSLYKKRFINYFEQTRKKILNRLIIYKNLQKIAKIYYSVRSNAKNEFVLSIYGEALASLYLKSFQLDRPASGIEVYEDRNFNNRIDSIDHKLPIVVKNNRITFKHQPLKIYVGRDFSLEYDPFLSNEETFLRSKKYTRLFPLETRLILRFASMDSIIIQSFEIDPSIGDVQVSIYDTLPPQSHSYIQSIHPWLKPKIQKGKRIEINGSYDLDHDLIVGPSDTLIILPNSVIRLGPGVSIICQSRISLNKVTFKRLFKSKPWGVFALQGKQASGSILTNCTFEGGSEDEINYIYYSGMLSAYYADNITVKNSYFSNNVLGDDVIRFAKSKDLRIENVIIENAIGDAIDCDISTGIIRNVRIISPMNDGIDLMTSNIVIENFSISNAGDKGISIGEDSPPLIRSGKIIGSNIGIGIKDRSDPKIEQIQFIKNKIAISGYNKNWRYPGGGKGIVKNSIFQDNQIEIKLDEESFLKLENCILEGKFLLPKHSSNQHLILINNNK